MLAEHEQRTGYLVSALTLAALALFMLLLGRRR